MKGKSLSRVWLFARWILGHSIDAWELLDEREKAPTQELDAQLDMSEPGGLYAKWNKPGRERQTLCCHLFVKHERKEGGREKRKEGKIHRSKEYKRSCRRWKWKSLSGVGSLSLLQGIFPTQGLNPGLLHCRLIPYQLSHKGSRARGGGQVNRDQLVKWCQVSAVRGMRI